VHYKSPYLFLLDAPDFIFLCRRHTPPFTFPLDIHYNRQHYPWPIHRPSLLLFIYYYFLSPSAITLLFLFCLLLLFYVFGYFIPLPIDDPFPHLFGKCEKLW
jgi:hypothetical protein